jgi:restriction system protein
VHCKRQKEKVEKIVVKALYADILDAKARSGLIVTTSMLSSGAEKVCTARTYPIMQANRDTLRQWVMTMRSPYSGIFLGE